MQVDLLTDLANALTVLKPQTQPKGERGYSKPKALPKASAPPLYTQDRCKYCQQVGLELLGKDRHRCWRCGVMQ